MPPAVDLKRVLRAVLREYGLPWHGRHGVDHWARVLENGLRLAETTGADVEVVSLFALLHDSRRENEGIDPQHGPRAAMFAAELRGNEFALSDDQFALLHAACFGHTHDRTHSDITVQTCYDADRLDLGRVGITPHPSRLCTAAAKDRSMLRWADGRGTMRIIPDIVTREWKIQLPGRD